MTDAKDYCNVAQDPDFLARNAKDQQQASPEAIARYRASFERQHDQGQINRAIMAYETARMAARPKPKFILEIKDDHFYARPRATFADVLIVAATGAAWFGLLFSLWVIFA